MKHFEANGFEEYKDYNPNAQWFDLHYLEGIKEPALPFVVLVLQHTPEVDENGSLVKLGHFRSNDPSHKYNLVKFELYYSSDAAVWVPHFRTSLYQENNLLDQVDVCQQTDDEGADKALDLAHKLLETECSELLIWQPLLKLSRPSDADAVFLGWLPEASLPGDQPDFEHALGLSDL